MIGTRFITIGLLKARYSEVSGAGCPPAPSVLVPPGNVQKWSFHGSSLFGEALTVASSSTKPRWGKHKALVYLLYPGQRVIWKRIFLHFAFYVRIFYIESTCFSGRSGSFPVYLSLARQRACFPPGFSEQQLSLMPGVMVSIICQLCQTLVPSYSIKY